MKEQNKNGITDQDGQQSESKLALGADRVNCNGKEGSDRDNIN